jgi:hypothetical protein
LRILTLQHKGIQHNNTSTSRMLILSIKAFSKITLSIMTITIKAFSKIKYQH